MKRKTVRKIIYFFAVSMAALAAFAWIYPNYLMRIDTAEIDRYYDMLSAHRKPAKEPVLALGIGDGSDLSAALGRIQHLAGLGHCSITLSYNDLKKPPAYIVDAGDNNITISISRGLKTRAEQISVLVHEMCHIYVRNLDEKVFGACDKERLVDCAGVFLGFGAPILNGLTDDILVMPGEGFETEQKFFGYIKPEQFGYLFARYCAEQGVPASKVMPHLGWAGKKYFTIGCNYYKRNIK